MTEYTPYIAFTLGILSRIFLPWLAAKRNEPNMGWSWRLVTPQLISVLIVALLLPLVADFGALGTLPTPAAYLAGWAAADVGREADKLIVG